MIYHRNTAVRIVAVDRPTGDVTIETLSGVPGGTGAVRCVPMLSLRATGGDRELRSAILKCEANQKQEKGEK